MDTSELREFAENIRKRIIQTAYESKHSVYLGGAMSMVDILAVLYGKIMRYNPQKPKSASRDRLILSKGHACIGLYAALNLIGVISDDEMGANYQTDGGYLTVHCEKNIGKGIECTSGSLGMGLSFGVGKALAAKLDKKSYRVYVIVGDGECNEGSIWEAAAAARQYLLDNLVLIIDKNKYQFDGQTKDIMDIDLNAVLTGFGWKVFNVDGNSVESLIGAFTLITKYSDGGVPCAIIANTVKGKGVSFMESDSAWHGGHLSENQYLKVMGELNSDRN